MRESPSNDMKEDAAKRRLIGLGLLGIASLLIAGCSVGASTSSHGAAYRFGLGGGPKTRTFVNAEPLAVRSDVERGPVAPPTRKSFVTRVPLDDAEVSPVVSVSFSDGDGLQSAEPSMQIEDHAASAEPADTAAEAQPPQKILEVAEVPTMPRGVVFWN